ncbi:MAG: hypothetical protein KGJ41_07910 [Rhodospirillales bacterium]|nr:hypothetical protein [Rhodospirillales bacterium]
MLWLVPLRSRRWIAEFLDAAHISFPLCCALDHPARFGERFRPPVTDGLSAGLVLPGAEPSGADTREAEAIGLVEDHGHRMLSLRHSGTVALSVEGGPAEASVAGCNFVDTATGLVRASALLWRVRPERAPGFAVLLTGGGS